VYDPPTHQKQIGAGFLSLRVSSLPVRKKAKASKSLDKKIQKYIVTQWILYTRLSRPCSCGLPLRE
jgi:hypothetical protein